MHSLNLADLEVHFNFSLIFYFRSVCEEVCPNIAYIDKYENNDRYK